MLRNGHGVEATNCILRTERQTFFIIVNNRDHLPWRSEKVYTQFLRDFNQQLVNR